MDTLIIAQSDHQRAVGARLRRLLELLDLAQTEAAELMGVSKQSLNNWLRGDSYPPAYPIYRLCRARGVDFNFIMLGDWGALRSSLATVLERELLAAPPQAEPGAAAPARGRKATETSA